MTVPALQSAVQPRPTPNLADLVLSVRLLSPETLARARLVQTETGERLDSVLTRLGLVSEQALAEAMAAATGLRIAANEDFPTTAVAADKVTPTFLRESKAVVLRQTGQGYDVAMSDALDPFPIAALAMALDARISVAIARSSDIEAALDRLYGNAAAPALSIDEEAEAADLDRLKDLASDAPAIRAVNRLIMQAVERRASDIHLESTEDALAVRFRIDGAMHEIEALAPAMKAAMVSRIKVMSGLNIAEKRLPQDGRLRLAVRGHDVDLRIATSPSINGESVVMRLLDRSNLTLDFAALGFDAPLLERLRTVLALPHGIMLVTGPTGSGKTTTLYAALAALNTPDRKILTIEDPIEYRLAGINQTQINTPIGLTFAAALRSFLRQDPDIMMVGEIRDLETAQVAVQAALTGHMILSTLHTNSAAAAVTRLLNMGVEPFLITSTLNAVLAQRLVRRLCAACRRATLPPADAIQSGLDGAAAVPSTVYHPVGCKLCNETGFKGRVALTELLVIDDTLAKLVLARAEARELHKAALAASMRTMLQDGLLKVAAGLTTLEEVLRVTQDA